MSGDHLIYAIGDVHGELSILDDLLSRIEKDANGEPYQLVYLGDYIDRGPNSKGVIDRLIEQKKADWEYPPVFLDGNHDQAMRMMLHPRDIITIVDMWFRNGAPATFESYGIKSYPPVPGENESIPEDIYIPLGKAFADAVGPEHARFLSELKVSFETDKYFFCHAGVDFDRPLDLQSNYDLRNIRTRFLASDQKAAKIIVHGHAITEKFKPEIHPNRIAVDTGAYWSGKLTACVLKGNEPPRFVETNYLRHYGAFYP